MGLRKLSAMKPFSFVHAADLHIDSPFRGVTTESAPERVARALHRSTFQAFDALIALTLEREADFLLVAGDVYDSRDRSLRAQLRLRDGLARLDAVGIPSFLVHGNHDPLDSRVSALEWPDHAHFFDRELTTPPAGRAGADPVALISGISFPRREETRNLAALFSRQRAERFQIGLLHCNVGGDARHADYAPCTLEDLRGSGLDYWALGHVHGHAILHESPWVVYPGCLQGRSIREQGARGCVHVRVDEDGQVDVEFVPLDTVRWQEIVLSLEDLEDIDTLERSLAGRVEEAAAACDPRGLVCRVRLTGRSPLHRDLQREDNVTPLLERLRERFAEAEPFIWVQRIDDESSARIDLASRRNGQDMLAEILTIAAELADRPGGLEALFQDPLQELWGNSRMARARLAGLSGEELAQVLTRAQLLCVDLLEEQP